MALLDFVPLALEGIWKGWAAVGIVLTGIAIFWGTIYMLLWGIYGARQAFWVVFTATMGFMILLSLIWLVGSPGTIPGTGPRGTEPSWRPFLAQSEQGQRFPELLAEFPEGWDELGESYPGGVSGDIDSAAEVDQVKPLVLDALARLGQAQGLEATEPEDWNFRLPGTAPASEREAELPVATVRFVQRGTPLLAGFQIPATDQHRAITVFALRDTGSIYAPSLIFLIVSVLGFAAGTFALARHERREQERAERGTEVKTPEAAGV